MNMKQISNTYTTILTILVSITLISLLLSSLGGVLKNPHLAHFWYLALIGMIMILAISLVVGTMLALSCIFLRRSSRNGPKGSRDRGFTGEVCVGIDRCKHNTCPLLHIPSPFIRRAMARREVVTGVSQIKRVRA
jgi:hypothetical protein